MNLWRNVSLVTVLLLFQCTVSSDGFLLALLVKIIALKGALFIGTPIALGSFVVGQGLGFLAGNLAGGYAVLKSAQKYHEKEKTKWQGNVKGHGWGWQSQKYSKGYKKGYGVGNAIAEFVNYVKTKPSHHDYHDDGYGYGYPSYSYGYPQHSSGYGTPHDSYGVPVGGYNRFDVPIAAISHAAMGPYKEQPSLLTRLTSKLPSFLGGKSKGDPHPSYVPAPGFVPMPDYYSPSPYSTGPESAYYDYGMMYPPVHPMEMYYPQTGGGHVPQQSFAPPQDSYGIPPAHAPPQDSYGAPPVHAPPQVHSYAPPSTSYLPIQSKEPEKLFEDSEYTYSSSPYAKPKPKRPQRPISDQDMYPGEAASYDGPAKEYTGVMTDIYQSIQNMKRKPYGGKPLGPPMGMDEFQLSVSEEYASSSDRDEQILDLASSLHNAQRRKDTAKPKLTPNYIMEKYLEKKLKEKAEKAKDEQQRKEVKEIISLLRKAYLQQLAESMISENDDEVENDTEAPSAAEPTSPSPSDDKAKFVPFVTISPNNRFKREEMETSSENPANNKNNPLLNLSSDQLEQVKMLYSFMEEIKQFFTLVSVLDEDTCLQKMVCDVHAQKAAGQEASSSTNYVSNMISTFAIMDVLVPFDPSAPEDSTTKYRLAAKIGGIGASSEVCKSYYSTCAYTSEEIINLGTQVAATTEPPPQQQQPQQQSQQQQQLQSQQHQSQLQSQQQQQLQQTVSEESEEFPTTAPSPVFGDRIQRTLEDPELSMPKV